MMKHIESCIFNGEIPHHVLNLSRTVISILNRPTDGHVNIVGTGMGSDSVQVYGWQSPVASHTDNTGFIFFMPITCESGKDHLVCEAGEFELQIGNLYLLDASKPHSTIGTGNVTALFMGSFRPDQINDELIAHVSKKFIEYLNPL